MIREGEVRVVEVAIVVATAISHILEISKIWLVEVSDAPRRGARALGLTNSDSSQGGGEGSDSTGRGGPQEGEHPEGEAGG